MAHPKVPSDIFDQHWPPEPKKKTGPDCEDTFVPEVIMSLLNQSILSSFWNDELMLPMRFSMPERPIQDEKQVVELRND